MHVEKDQTVTTRVIGTVVGSLIIVLAAWLLHKAVQQFLLPHGDEGGSWTLAFFTIGLFILLMGVLLVFKSLQPTPHPMRPMDDGLPGERVHHDPSDPCSGCGRWDKGVTSSCPECAKSHGIPEEPPGGSPPQDR